MQTGFITLKEGLVRVEIIGNKLIRVSRGKHSSSTKKHTGKLSSCILNLQFFVPFIEVIWEPGLLLVNNINLNSSESSGQSFNG